MGGFTGTDKPGDESPREAPTGDGANTAGGPSVTEEELREIRKALGIVQNKAKLLANDAKKVAQANWELASFVVKEQTKFAAIKVAVGLHLWILVGIAWLLLNAAIGSCIYHYTGLAYVALLVLFAIQVIVIAFLASYLRKLDI